MKQLALIIETEQMVPFEREITTPVTEDTLFEDVIGTTRDDPDYRFVEIEKSIKAGKTVWSIYIPDGYHHYAYFVVL